MRNACTTSRNMLGVRPGGRLAENLRGRLQLSSVTWFPVAADLSTRSRTDDGP